MVDSHQIETEFRYPLRLQRNIVIIGSKQRIGLKVSAPKLGFDTILEYQPITLALQKPMSIDGFVFIIEKTQIHRRVSPVECHGNPTRIRFPTPCLVHPGICCRAGRQGDRHLGRALPDRYAPEKEGANPSL